jgi:hypothetical protein
MWKSTRIRAMTMLGVLWQISLSLRLQFKNMVE